MATRSIPIEPELARATRDTIVIGTSSGGGAALTKLAKALPSDLPAAVLVVAHQYPDSPGYLADILQRVTPLTVRKVEGRERIVAGSIYVAPPDRHMVLVDGDVAAVMGPMENRTRPAINPLFRTAAAWRPGRTIGVLLTGLLDDGVAGLAAIKRCGGVAVVQDPADADFPEMPRNAIAAVDVDHIAPLARIPELLAALTAEAAPHVDVPDDIRIEAEMSGPFGSSAARVDAIGDRIPMSCPSCGGPLWTVHGGGDVYRCSVGHAFTPAALLAGQSDELERGLWIAVRTLEERAGVLSSLARDSAARGFPERVYEQRAAEASRYARQLRDLLVRICTGGRASPGETEED